VLPFFQVTHQEIERALKMSNKMASSSIVLEEAIDFNSNIDLIEFWYFFQAKGCFCKNSQNDKTSRYFALVH